MCKIEPCLDDKNGKLQKKGFVRFRLWAQVLFVKRSADPQILSAGGSQLLEELCDKIDHTDWSWHSSLEYIGAGIILRTGLASERRRYIVNSTLIGWALTQNDPCIDTYMENGVVGILWFR